MGEHIRNLSTFTLNGQKVIIELNRRNLENTEYDIHIEAPFFRYNMTDCEFMKIVASVATAEKKLKDKKKGQ